MNLIAAIVLSSTLGISTPATDAAVDAGAVAAIVAGLDVVTDMAPRKATLGAEIVWTTSVTHPADGSIGYAATFTGGALTVKSADIQAEGAGRSRIRIVLTGLTLGEFSPPPLQLRFTGRDGSDHPFQVLGGKVEIAAQGDPQTDHADAAPPVPIERWNPYFFGTLAALVLAAFAYWWWRTHRPPAPPPPPYVDPRTPAQVALDAIFKLQTQSMLERREIKPYTYALDDIVRAFIIAMAGAGEMAQTTDEFVADVAPRLTEPRAEHVRTFFNQGDRVRFAGEEHEEAEARTLCDTAIALINELAPAPLVASVPADKGGTP